MCDSSIPGEDAGRLDDETLGWLGGVLAGSGGLPVFVAFHHPPVQLHGPAIDGIIDEAITIALDLTVAGDAMSLDFSRSSPPCPGTPPPTSRATSSAAGTTRCSPFSASS